MHLRDPDPVGDLTLGQAAEEAQAQDLTLAGRQRVQALAQKGAPLGLGERLVHASQRVRGGLAALALGLVERHRRVGLGALHRVEHALHARVRRGRQLLDRRRAAQAVGHPLDLLGQAGVELLQIARHPQRPHAVTEVALDLAENGGDGESGKLELSAQIEAVDGLDQAQRPHLLEIVERLPSIGVAGRQTADQRQHPLDQDIAGREVSILVVAAQQLMLLEPRSVSDQFPHCTARVKPCPA